MERYDKEHIDIVYNELMSMINEAYDREKEKNRILLEELEKK